MKYRDNLIYNVYKVFKKAEKNLDILNVEV